MLALTVIKYGDIVTIRKGIHLSRQKEGPLFLITQRCGLKSWTQNGICLTYSAQTCALLQRLAYPSWFLLGQISGTCSSPVYYMYG